MPNESYIIENQLSEPKSSFGAVELPCGIVLPDGQLVRQATVREITGVEEDMLASNKVPAHKKLGALVSNCITAIGPVQDRASINALAPKLLVGDRVALLLAIRRVSLGDVYPFRDQCPDCGHKGLFDINLGSMETKQMPDPSKRSYKVTTPRGTEVTFHPMDGHGEEKLAALSKEEDRISLALLARIDLINGEPPTLKRVKELGMIERQFLREAYEDVEGGVDTEIQIDCPNCGSEFSRELDISQPGFFFPSATRKASKSK
jgi:hypothetical protein